MMGEAFSPKSAFEEVGHKSGKRAELFGDAVVAQSQDSL